MFNLFTVLKAKTNLQHKEILVKSLDFGENTVLLHKNGVSSNGILIVLKQTFSFTTAMPVPLDFTSIRSSSGFN